MGLSASQARLLSITARLSDNELHSQQIANSRVRLADKTQEASQEYINALNTTKLMYTTYDAQGNASEAELTPAILYEYSDLKNQYGISNTSGQLLVSSTDAAHFENSNNLSAFVESYGIDLAENPEYTEKLQLIYGEDYTSLYNENDVYEWYDAIENITGSDLTYIKRNICSQNPENLTQADADLIGQKVNSWAGQITSLQNGLLKNYADLTGDFGAYLRELLTVPNLEFPDKNSDIYENTSVNEGLDKKFDIATKPCYENAVIDKDPKCYLHVLAHILDLKEEHLVSSNGNNTSGQEITPPGNNNSTDNTNPSITQQQSTNTTSNGVDSPSTDTGDSIIDTPDNPADNVGNIGGQIIGNGGVNDSYGATYSTTVDPALTITTTPFDINGSAIYSNGLTPSMVEVSEVICDTVDILYAKEDPSDTTTYNSSVAQKLISNYKFVYNSETGNYDKVLKTMKEKTIDLYYAVANRDDLGLDYDKDLVPILENYQAEISSSLEPEFNETKYLNDVKSWQNEILAWVTGIENLKLTYSEHLDEIPGKTIPDETNSKTQWYINLWHRMNGQSEMKSTEGKNGTYYKQLDDNLLTSNSWLKFALEHGAVTLEKVQYVDEAEDTTGLETTKWTPVIYSACTDITTVEDTVAITRAEAAYTEKLNEIEAKDNKLENDIKKLDTEHNALQTEYESVKSVIDKNVERSFKAFS